MRALWLTVPLLLLAACDKSKPGLEKALAESQKISAEKDSLLRDVLETSQFLSEVNVDLARVRGANVGKPVQGKPGDLESNLTPAQQRAAIKAKIEEFTTRLNATESRLAASRARVQELASANSALAAQLVAYDSTISAFKTLITSQRVEIASLTEQLSTLQRENVRLRQEKVELADEKTALTADKDALTVEKNRVYYVAGSADELLKAGIVEKAGGFLGFGRTMVPTREAPTTGFTALDRTTALEIAFPRGDKLYRIVSRQDVSALSTAPSKDGRFGGGAIRISDPEKFWAASKFLILVEQ